MSDDVSGVPVGVTLGLKPLSRWPPGVTGLASLPVLRKLGTQPSLTAVAVYMSPARPGAAGIGCLKAQVTLGGLIGRDRRAATGNQRHGPGV